MKNLNFYQMHIRQKIQISADVERVRFGFYILKRLLADYKEIGEQGYLPGIDVFDKAVRLINNYLEFRLLNQDENLQLINQVELISPMTDNLSQSEASCVFNTISSLNELLYYLGDNDHNHIFAISDLMIKVVEFKILDRYEQISYEEIDNHPIFVNELKYQLELFDNNKL